jgi:hypothetical protein
VTAIEATSYTMRTLVDGTLAVTLHIEPRFAREAFALFGAPGQPVAVAALVPEHARESVSSYSGKPIEPAIKDTVKDTEKDKPRGGPLSQWVAMRCAEPEFQAWLQSAHGMPRNPPIGFSHTSVAANVVRRICDVQSRAEIDTDPEARARFHERIMGPWQRHCASR